MSQVGQDQGEDMNEGLQRTNIAIFLQRTIYEDDIYVGGGVEAGEGVKGETGCGLSKPKPKFL